MANVPALQRAVAEIAESEQRRKTLINYWCETTGWVRVDWNEIVDVVVAAYLTEIGENPADRWERGTS